jgi:two-component system sensor histidine kinase/response regulator
MTLRQTSDTGADFDASTGPAGRDRYELLVNHTRDIVLFTDPHGRIIEANAGAVRAYGRSRNELVGLEALELQSPESRPAARHAFERARAHETVVLETEHLRKSGQTFPVEVTLTSRPTESDTFELLAIVRDTTDRQVADDSLMSAYASAVDASRLKSEFVAAMGHEIRTPMNAIMGMSELMLDTHLTEDQRGFCEAVRQSGKALLRIIDDVLDFSQLESGGPEFEMADVDIAATVESTVAAFSARAADKGLTLTARLDSKIDGAVRADETRLRQVLIHLIDNAVKFTERGTVVVSVALEERDQWSTTLHFAVEDSGTGIEDDIARKIFEPFQQADRSATRKHTGAGLGLHIARRLVELMGGALTLESVPGSGSTFGFSARFDRAATNVKTSASALCGARLLVVDDDPLSRELIRRHADSWGMVHGEAPGGGAALEQLRERARAGVPYDVAIVDYTMPGAMGGLEFGMRVKGDRELADTQLILITAYKGLQQRQAVSTAGFSSYLTKPISRPQLFESVARAVHRARSLAALSRLSQGTTPLPATARTKRILLAEDHPVNRQLGLQQLKKLGFAALAVGNGEQALAALAADTYDLVFMDCQMPTMDGFAATRAIRALEAQTGGHVTIVAMTANALVEDRRECLAAGMDDHLAKPVQLEDLQTMIDRWIWDSKLATA